MTANASSIGYLAKSWLVQERGPPLQASWQTNILDGLDIPRRWGWCFATPIVCQLRLRLVARNLLRFDSHGLMNKVIKVMPLVQSSRWPCPNEA